MSAVTLGAAAPARGCASFGGASAASRAATARTWAGRGAIACAREQQDGHKVIAAAQACHWCRKFPLCVLLSLLTFLVVFTRAWAFRSLVANATTPRRARWRSEWLGPQQRTTRDLRQHRRSQRASAANAMSDRRRMQRGALVLVKLPRAGVRRLHYSTGAEGQEADSCEQAGLSEPCPYFAAAPLLCVIT